MAINTHPSPISLQHTACHHCIPF